MKNLSEGLQSLSSLQSLNLHTAYCNNITDKGLSDLSESLSKLGNLKSFLICLHNWKITDEGLKSLGEGLKRLSSLLNISLRCWT